MQDNDIFEALIKNYQQLDNLYDKYFIFRPHKEFKFNFLQFVKNEKHKNNIGEHS